LFLHRVLGFGLVLEDRARETIQHAVVTPHQRFEGALVALSDAARELGVVRRPLRHRLWNHPPLHLPL
jgi:hypothetical protein